MTNDSIKLTSFAHGGGCGCKVAPGILQEILGNRIPVEGLLLASNSGNEDAAVWDLGDDRILVSTTDFFMPIVDDPYTFGAIAAANALSDIYAMGANPIFALAILGWPIEKLPAHVAAQVMAGAADKCKEAGISIAGGHTVDNMEPLFGLSVNGIGLKKHLKRNSTLRVNDLIFLTKPLGTGMITSASKRKQVDSDAYSQAIEGMKKLNDVGAELGKLQGVHAMTDVTGFGLLGHALEMSGDNNVTIRFDLAKIPLLAGVSGCISSFVYPDMTMKNFNAFKNMTTELSAAELLILCDPQTSGGLLISAAAEKQIELKELLDSKGLYSEVIGEVLPLGEKKIIFSGQFTF